MCKKIEEQRIVVLGAKGNLGTPVTEELKRTGFTDVIEWTREMGDVTCFPELREKICNMKPDIVINTVAYNDVDACENEGVDQKRAYMLNVTLVDELSEICIRQGIKLIHFSTNYVFSGRDAEYTESSITSPINYYGYTKDKGEKIILEKNEKGLDGVIIRVSNLFGPPAKSPNAKKSFFQKIFEKSSQQECISLIQDEINCFTYTVDVAKRLAEMLKAGGMSGIYHFVNEDGMSWLEAARRFYALLGKDICLKGIESSSYERNALRPQNGVIVTTRIKPLRSFNDALADYVKGSGAGLFVFQ